MLEIATGDNRTATLGNTAITVGAGATFWMHLAAVPFSTMVNAGTTGSGSAGATLTLAAGSALNMANSAILRFNLEQENSFAGPAFTIGGASGVAPALTFDIGNGATGPDSIDVTKTVKVLATGGRITIDALAGDTTLTDGNYDLITSAGGFSGSGGNDLTLTDTTLVVDGTTYDFSLGNSTADDEVLTVSTAAVVAPVESRTLGEREGFPAIEASRAGSPLAGTAAIPEPGSTMSVLLGLALAAACGFGRRGK
jgi:hypothetical protein